MQINVTVILPCKRKAKSTKLPSIYRGFITEKKKVPNRAGAAAGGDAICTTNSHCLQTLLSCVF